MKMAGKMVGPLITVRAPAARGLEWGGGGGGGGGTQAQIVPDARFFSAQKSQILHFFKSKVPDPTSFAPKLI